jgi:hypothetical protein
MSVIVNLPPEFRRAVLAALAEICPCHDYSVSAVGVLSITPKRPQKRFCRCYCQHKAGCNLIADLVNHPTNWLVIAQTAQGNSYAGGMVFWNPSSNTGGPNARGDNVRPPSVGLAHELVHALDRMTGDTHTEVETSQAENQIRREQCEPRRTHYNGARVPNGGGHLDAGDRHRCRCYRYWLCFYCLHKKFWAFLRDAFWAPPILVIADPVSWEEAKPLLDDVSEPDLEGKK